MNEKAEEGDLDPDEDEELFDQIWSGIAEEDQAYSEERARSDLEPIDRDLLLQKIHELIPAPVCDENQIDGDVVLVGGDPGEVIVRISGSRVSIAVFSIRWEGPHTPTVRPKQVGTLNWKRLSLSRTLIVLHTLIASAREIRRATYRKCGKCKKENPPEWMHDKDICQSCAERHLGVVY